MADISYILTKPLTQRRNKTEYNDFILVFSINNGKNFIMLLYI